MTNQQRLIMTLGNQLKGVLADLGIVRDLKPNPSTRVPMDQPYVHTVNDYLKQINQEIGFKREIWSFALGPEFVMQLAKSPDGDYCVRRLTTGLNLDVDTSIEGFRVVLQGDYTGDYVVVTETNIEDVQELKSYII